jgi:hypothetical protein
MNFVLLLRGKLTNTRTKGLIKKFSKTEFMQVFIAKLISEEF